MCVCTDCGEREKKKQKRAKNRSALFCHPYYCAGCLQPFAVVLVMVVVVLMKLTKYKISATIAMCIKAGAIER